MTRAANRPEDCGYNEFFSGWLVRYRLNDMNKVDRAALRCPAVLALARLLLSGRVPLRRGVNKFLAPEEGSRTPH
jgi:hypothetical protein